MIRALINNFIQVIQMLVTYMVIMTRNVHISILCTKAIEVYTWLHLLKLPTNCVLFIENLQEKYLFESSYHASFTLKALWDENHRKLHKLLSYINSKTQGYPIYIHVQNTHLTFHNYTCCFYICTMWGIFYLHNLSTVQTYFIKLLTFYY